MLEKMYIRGLKESGRFAGVGVLLSYNYSYIVLELQLEARLQQGLAISCQMLWIYCIIQVECYRLILSKEHSNLDQYQIQHLITLRAGFRDMAYTNRFCLIHVILQVNTKRDCHDIILAVNMTCKRSHTLLPFTAAHNTKLVKKTTWVRGFNQNCNQVVISFTRTYENSSSPTWQNWRK